MIVKLNYKLISFLCAVLVVAGACFLFEPRDAAQASGKETSSAEPKTADEGVQVPIVMYHHMLKEKKRLGAYVVSPEEFESDVKYLKDQGFTTVVVEDLIHYVNQGTPLPKKPVMITFDDGYESTYEYALPILKKYNAKAVVSVVGAYSDLYSGNVQKNISYSYMTWEQVKEMQQSGFVEIQNHSYDMHEQKGPRHGARMVKGETVEEYKQALQDDLMLTQEKIKQATGKAPTCFTYPFGYIAKHSEEIIKELGFQASLSCASGISRVKQGDPDSLFSLKRYNRVHGGTTESFFKKAFQNLEV